MLRIINSIWHDFKEYIVLVLLLIICLLFFSQSDKPAVKKIKTFTFGGFSVLSSTFSNIITPFQTSIENERLRETNAKLMLEVNQLREYGIQNEELKKLLAFKSTTSSSLVAAKVISKIVSTSQCNIIINAGSNENIKYGMPVINDQGLIGLIVSVSKDFSIVRTLWNSELKLAVRNQRSRYDGIAEWDGNELIIKNVPKSYDMEVGDRIITSDFSTKFPPSIPVGLVSGGTREKTGLLNNIVVKPFVDFVRMENLFVIAIVPSTQKNNVELNLFNQGK
jgi:rod shape-determining protein MreC